MIYNESGQDHCVTCDSRVYYYHQCSYLKLICIIMPSMRDLSYILDLNKNYTGRTVNVMQTDKYIGIIYIHHFMAKRPGGIIRITSLNI